MRIERPSGLAHAALDALEPRLEAQVRAARGLLRIDVEMPREIRDREQHVAELGLDPAPLTARDRFVELAELLGDLLARAARIGPIEADACGAASELHGARQRRQPDRHAVENALRWSLLLPFQRLPGFGVRGSLGTRAAEHVRMTPHHLFADAARDVREPERPCLLRETRMEDDLEQQVAELVLELCDVAPLDRVRDLVRLLDRIRRDRLERLLEVPRAAALGVAQRRHDLEQPRNVVEFTPAHRQALL